MSFFARQQRLKDILSDKIAHLFVGSDDYPALEYAGSGYPLVHLFGAFLTALLLRSIVYWKTALGLSRLSEPSNVIESRPNRTTTRSMDLV